MEPKGEWDGDCLCGVGGLERVVAQLARCPAEGNTAGEEALVIPPGLGAKIEHQSIVLCGNCMHRCGVGGRRGVLRRDGAGRNVDQPARRCVWRSADPDSAVALRLMRPCVG